MLLSTWHFSYENGFLGAMSCAGQRHACIPNLAKGCLTHASKHVTYHKLLFKGGQPGMEGSLQRCHLSRMLPGQVLQAGCPITALAVSHS